MTYKLQLAVLHYPTLDNKAGTHSYQISLF